MKHGTNFHMIQIITVLHQQGVSKTTDNQIPKREYDKKCDLPKITSGAR